MSIRYQSITPYNGSQGPSNAPKHGEPKVKIKRDRSVHKAESSDSLYQALKGYPPILPETDHKFSPRGGKPYGPAGEFGRPVRREHTQATDFKSHRSKPGDNPLGRAPNRRGANALS